MSFAMLGTGYLAGPMTVRNRDGTYNYGEFHRVTGILRDAGHDMNNPAEHFGGITTLPRSEYIRAAVEAVLASDYVVLLPGWEFSPGANLELDIALELGHLIYEFIEEPDGFWYLRPLALRRRPTRSVPDGQTSRPMP